MRCPKCGYHSFDYLDNCKKCGVDLTEQKLRFKYQGFVAPVAATEAPAPLLDEAAKAFPAEAEAESEAIDFGFDVLGDEPAEALPSLEIDLSPDDSDLDDLAAADPSAVDLAAESGFSLDQPFGEENENLPSELPELDNRNGDFF